MGNTGSFRPLPNRLFPITNNKLWWVVVKGGGGEGVTSSGQGKGVRMGQKIWWKLTIRGKTRTSDTRKQVKVLDFTMIHGEIRDSVDSKTVEPPAYFMWGWCKPMLPSTEWTTKRFLDQKDIYNKSNYLNWSLLMQCHPTPLLYSVDDMVVVNAKT